MEPISPALAAKIQQGTNVNTNQAQYNNIKDTSLQQDTVEISSKKKSKAKTAFKIGAGIALAAGATVAILKQRDLSKAKKEISALYDVIFENASKNMSDVMNFEKPKLVFKKLDKMTGAQYLCNTNSIEIDPRRLRQTIIDKDLDKVSFTNISDNLNLANISSSGGVFDLFKKGAKDDYRIATKQEALAIEGSSLAHELMHAKQFQLLLSSEGGKEKLLQSIKAKNKTLSEKEIQELWPFVFNYKPKKIISENRNLYETLYDGIEFKYGFNDILKAFTDYTSDNKFEYYTNLAEISARNAEYAYWRDMKNGKLPRAEGISDEFLDSVATKTKFNSKLLINAYMKAHRG